MSETTYAQLGQVLRTPCTLEQRIQAYLGVTTKLWQNLVAKGLFDEAIALDSKTARIASNLYDGSYHRKPENAAPAIERLEKILARYAPPYCRFGQRDCDEKEIGYWVDFDGLDNAIHEGKVWDVWCHKGWPREVPEGVDHVLVCRNWGHMTLYDARTKEKVWENL